MARNTEVGIVYSPSDLRPERTWSIQAVFDTAGGVAGLTLPLGALGVGLYPRTNDVRFSLDNPPDPTPIVTALPTIQEGIKAAELGRGAIAKGNQWTRRLLPGDKPGYTLYVLAESANTTVDIEVW
jgi:hypothetical protein